MADTITIPRWLFNELCERAKLRDGRWISVQDYVNVRDSKTNVIRKAWIPREDRRGETFLHCPGCNYRLGTGHNARCPEVFKEASNG